MSRNSILRTKIVCRVSISYTVCMDPATKNTITNSVPWPRASPQAKKCFSVPLLKTSFPSAPCRRACVCMPTAYEGRETSDLFFPPCPPHTHASPKKKIVRFSAFEEICASQTKDGGVISLFCGHFVFVLGRDFFSGWPQFYGGVKV